MPPRPTIRHSQAFLSALLLILIGCAGDVHKIVLGNASTSVFDSTRTNFSRYKTFSVCPFNSAPIESAGAQLMFFLRNQMEEKGYEFVAPNKNPDMWAAQKLYPQTEPAPEPSETLPSLFVSTFTSAGDSRSWGEYTSTPLTDPLDFNRASSFTGQAAAIETQPDAIVVVYDGKTNQRLWHGIGHSDSDSRDPRISGQDAIMAALANFPGRPQKEESSERYGAIGVRLQIYTTDGISYQPMVIAFAMKSPARDAGMKEKDRIISVDGQSLTNMSFAESNRLIRGRPDSIVTLEVAREDQTLSFTIKRLPWSGIWGSLSPDD